MTSFVDTLRIVVGKRWSFVVALFVLEMAAILIISNSAFFPGELSSTQQQYNQIKPVLNQDALGQVVGIFANNFRVAIIELIPIGGPTIFAFSIYETARIVEVIGISNGEGAGAALGTLFFLPSTWLELPAYAVAVTESCYLLYAVYAGFSRGWGVFTREIRFLFVSILSIVGILLIAAVFEVTEIQIEFFTQPPAPAAEGLLVLLTWIPFAYVFWKAVSFWRSSRKVASQLEAMDAAEAAQSQGGPPGWEI